jgi:hypothetical protein
MCRASVSYVQSFVCISQPCGQLSPTCTVSWLTLPCCLPCANSWAVCSPVPGFVSHFIYRNDLGAGWGWRPYSSKNTVVRQPAMLHRLLCVLVSIALSCLLTALRLIWMLRA